MSESTESNSLFESIRKRNDAFEEVYPGPKHEEVSVKVHESVSDEAFEATWGITREKLKEENEQAVNKLFEPQEIGSVFEKQDKLDEQPRFSETPNKGLGNIDWDAFYDESDTMDPNQPHLSRQPTRFEDAKIYYHDTKDTATGVGLEPETLNKLKEQVDKLDNSKKEMDPTMSGPKFLIPDMVK